MSAIVLLGRGDKILEIPESTWKQELAHIPAHSHERLSFMTKAHHRVRYFSVRELVKRQKPLAPELISGELGLPLAQVKAILEELEKKLFFLVRDERGAVAWAFPVTVEATPHKLKFSSGEQLYGA